MSSTSPLNLTPTDPTSGSSSPPASSSSVLSDPSSTSSPDPSTSTSTSNLISTTSPSSSVSTTPSPSSSILSTSTGSTQDSRTTSSQPATSTTYETRTVTAPNTSPSSTIVVTRFSTSTLPLASTPTFSTSSSTSTVNPSLQNGGQGSGHTGGLSTSGKVAIAVVVPIVVVAALVFLLIFCWRKRKQRKEEEEDRRKEVEEYGYNPNEHPTFPAVAMARGADSPEMTEDTSGYRGWGNNTNGPSYSNRKASTTLSGGALSGQITNHMAARTISDEGRPPVSPESSNPSDPLMQNYNSYGHDGLGDAAVGTAVTTGGGAVAGATASRNDNIHRGPSNASSSYSVANGSEPSNEGHYGAGYGNNYSEYTNYQEQQPVVREVSARRATRIESPTVSPQQGNAGIALNF